MTIDPRLPEIKDCLYRVAVKAVIVHEQKILLVMDDRDTEFSFPGGGIDYGETAEQALYRELHEEAGIKSSDIESLELLCVVAGHQKNGIPRTNIFYFVKSDISNIETTNEVSSYRWFTLDELKNEKLDTSTGDISELLKMIPTLIS